MAPASARRRAFHSPARTLYRVAMALSDPIEAVRAQLVSRVRTVFNDTQGGQEPVPPSDDALFAKDTPIRMVHADLVGMMVGGVRGLLLQMLHPHALQGVLDHSDFRADMHGRLRRTARFIAVTTFGARDAAQQSIDRVNRIHERVGGTLPDGTPYSCARSTYSGLGACGRGDELPRRLSPLCPASDASCRAGRLLPPVRCRRAEAGSRPGARKRGRGGGVVSHQMRGDLRSSPEAREVAQLVLTQKPEGTPPGVQEVDRRLGGGPAAAVRARDAGAARSGSGIDPRAGGDLGRGADHALGVPAERLALPPPCERAAVQLGKVGLVGDRRFAQSDGPREDGFGRVPIGR